MTLAALSRVNDTLGEEARRAVSGHAFIDRRMTIPPGKERVLFGMPVPAISRHIMSGTLFVDGPKGVDLTLTVRFLNGQRQEGHVVVPEARIGAAQVAVPVPVALGGQNLLVPLSLRGWCGVNGGAGVRVQVVAKRTGGADCGRVVIRSGWVSCFTP